MMAPRSECVSSIVRGHLAGRDVKLTGEWGCDSKLCGVSLVCFALGRSRQMAGAEMTDEELVAFLREHPDFRNRVAPIALVHRRIQMIHF
jgi:hypothetical protein